MATESGTVEGIPSFDFRKLGGHAAAVTVTIGNLTPKSLTFDSDGVEGSNTFAAQTIGFTESVTFSTTPTQVTFEITDLDQGSSTGITNSRLYTITIDKTASLSNDLIVKENSNYTVSPNPVQNSFALNADIDGEIETLQIFNITGKLVKSFSGQTNYDISDLASGMYIATIKTKDQISSVKLIKE